MLQSTEPPQTFVTTTMFTVTVGDPNVSDDLYVRWIAEYPPFSSTNSKLLKDMIIPHSMNGKVLQAPDSIAVDCDSMLARLPYHPITAIVSDQPFYSPKNPPPLPDPATLLAGIRSPGLSVEAHWVLSLLCQ